MAIAHSFRSIAEVVAYNRGEIEHGDYMRYGSPKMRHVESILADMDEGEDSVLFSSGMAALTTMVMSHVKAGDSLVVFDECYHRMRRFCHETLGSFGVDVIQVKTGDFNALYDALLDSDVRMVIAELPTNPFMTTFDLGKFAALCKATGTLFAVDATMATPKYVKPLVHGCDFVVHSCTKYLGGYNAVMAGVVTGSRDLIEEVRQLRSTLGCVTTDESLDMLERGLDTFDVRMDRHTSSGQVLNEVLQGMPGIGKVYYPGYGGVVTFEVDSRTGREFVDDLKVPMISPSFGSTRSMVNLLSVLSYGNHTREQRIEMGITDNLVRYSCGIEDPNDIIYDIRTAC